MITLYTLITIVACHWVFDFFLQDDQMAKNKSKYNFALLDHTFIYTVGILLMAALNYQWFDKWYYGLAFVGINSVAHFMTDWVTSRATSLLYKEERYHDFFVCIGFDQFCHYITLFGVFTWLTRL
jgi:hypothetical protein